ncbi:MAG: acyl carrier protein phosphodiesterase [Bacteroidetes bacterium]|nr:acyl carrier protein phosphodiesterase [Bacteroidota bacterium]
MNFLGHLFFSGDNHKLMASNLFGDFIKGKDLSHLSYETQKGIYLHRQIDQYIDHHPAVLELMHTFYPILPKVTGLAIDLFFDHLLAKNWRIYSEIDLAAYTQQFYDSIDFENPDFNANFKMVLSKMKEKNWLYQYQFPYGLYKACQGVSSRISFPNELKNGLIVFEANESIISSTFAVYMNDAIPHFQSIRANLNNLV